MGVDDRTHVVHDRRHLDFAAFGFDQEDCFGGRDADQTRRVEAAGYEILALCMEMGGSITGEHGVGSEKLEHVPMMFDESDLDVMARVRDVFNPRGLCNPGKVLPERRSCAEVAKWPQMVERVLDED